jgi:hypothetical protein
MTPAAIETGAANARHHEVPAAFLDPPVIVYDTPARRSPGYRGYQMFTIRPRAKRTMPESYIP